MGWLLLTLAIPIRIAEAPDDRAFWCPCQKQRWDRQTSRGDSEDSARVKGLEVKGSLFRSREKYFP
jgi:hypothetical protein